MDTFFEYYINQQCGSPDDKFAHAYFVVAGDAKGFVALESILHYLFEVMTNTWKIDYKDKSFQQSCNEFTQTMPDCSECNDFKIVLNDIDLHGAKIDYRLFAYRLFYYCKKYFITVIKTCLFDIAFSNNKDENKDSIELNNNDDKYLVYSMAGAIVNSLVRKVYGKYENSDNKTDLVKTIRKLIIDNKNETIDDITPSINCAAD